MSSIRIEDKSKEAIDAMNQQVKNALWAIGATAEGYAKDNTPIDTGRLRNSISHAEYPEEKSVYIGTNVEYGPAIELGSTRNKAHHMLRDAIADHGKEYENMVKLALES